MKKKDEMEKYYCWVNGKEYVYTFSDPKFNENGKTYSGVAIVQEKSDLGKSFTVPFFLKYDEICICTQKISATIEMYIKEKTKS